MHFQNRGLFGTSIGSPDCPHALEVLIESSAKILYETILSTQAILSVTELSINTYSGYSGVYNLLRFPIEA